MSLQRCFGMCQCEKTRTSLKRWHKMLRESTSNYCSIEFDKQALLSWPYSSRFDQLGVANGGFPAVLETNGLASLPVHLTSFTSKKHGKQKLRVVMNRTVSMSKLGLQLVSLVSIFDVSFEDEAWKVVHGFN